MTTPENPSDFPFDEPMFPELSVDPATGHFRLGDEVLAPTDRLVFEATSGLINIINDNIIEYGGTLGSTVNRLLSYASHMQRVERDSDHIVQRDELWLEKPYLPDSTVDEDRPLPAHLQGKGRISAATHSQNLIAIELYAGTAGCTKDEAVYDLLAKGNWVRHQLKDGHTFEAWLKSGEHVVLGSSE